MLARMKRPLPSLFLGAALLALCGCSTVVVQPASGQGGSAAAAAMARTTIPGGSYVVARGDTLYSIAFRNKVDFRDLAKWNGIAAPYTIWPGQHLRLSPAAANVPAAQPVVAAASASAPAARPTATENASSAPMFENVPAPVPTTPSASPAPTAATATPPAQLPAAPAPVAAPTPSAPAPVSRAPVLPVPSSATTSSEVPVAGEPKATVPPPVTPSAPVSGSARAAGGVNWHWPADGQIIKRFTPGDAVPGIEIAGKAGDPVRAAADGVVVYSGNGLVGYGELVIIKHNDSLLSAYGHNSKRLVKEGQRVSAGQQIAEMGSSGASRVELGFQIRKDGNPVDPLNYLPAK